MARYERSEVLQRLHSVVAQGKLVVVAGAGTGLSAKCEEEGGADLIVVYNSGKYRMDGVSSLAGFLAYGNANDLMLELGGRIILPAVKETPVVAGVMGTDPTRRMKEFLKRVDEEGFSGIINFPTVGVFDGRWRRWLEETGLGFSKEVEMIGVAGEMGLFTLAYVFSPEGSVAMVEAGADVIVAHTGLTVGGTVGAKNSLSLEESAVKVQRICDAAKRVKKDVLVFSHGGPIATPGDVEYIQRNTVGVTGFVGASSIERIPVESALTQAVRRFKEVKP